MSERQNGLDSQSKSDDENQRRRASDRGQIDPRLVVGGAVLLLIAGPLLAVAVDIQAALASTPVFTGLSAAVIAVLLVTTIGAATLGLE